MLELELPWPPSVNHYWGERVMGRRIMRFVGKKGKEFRNAVTLAVEPHLLKCQHEFSKPNRLQVEVFIYPPDKRRRDIDNLCKSLLDAMQHAGVYDDDEQIDDLLLHRNKLAITKGGAVLVTITAIECDSDEW